MPLPVIANTARCSVQGGWSGSADRWANVLHFGATGIDADACAAAFVTAWTDNVLGVMSSQCFTEDVTVTVLDGTSTSAVAGINLAGTASPPSLPHQCAAVISRRTALRGRSNRGRTYLTGLVSSYPSSGDSSVFNSGALTALQAASDGFDADMETAGFIIGVASYKNAVFLNQVSGTVDADIFTQRRRVGRPTVPSD